MKAVEINLGMRNWEQLPPIMEQCENYDDTVVLPIDGFRFYVVSLDAMDEIKEYVESICPDAEFTNR